MNVDNKGIIRKLTARFLKAGRTRNIVVIAAIVLTSVMFTSVFTIGVNMLTTVQNQTKRMVGTSAHGGLKYLTMEQYAHIAGSSLLRDSSYLIALSVAGNAELEKVYTELGYAEDKIAAWQFAFPAMGSSPPASASASPGQKASASGRSGFPSCSTALPDNCISVSGWMYISPPLAPEAISSSASSLGFTLSASVISSIRLLP